MFDDDLFDDPFMNEMLLNPDLYGLEEEDSGRNPYENNNDGYEDDDEDYAYDKGEKNINYISSDLILSPYAVKNYKDEEKAKIKNPEDEYDEEGLMLREKYINIFFVTFVSAILIMIIIFFIGNAEKYDMLEPLFVADFILLTISTVYAIKYNFVEKKKN